MTYKEVLQAAQGQMGPCRACPVCNGRACGGTIPGPGAKGSGTVAIRNFDAWRNVRLNMDTIHENFEPDTSLTLFGRSFKYPFFAGPVGAMALHYGDKYNDAGLQQYPCPRLRGDAGIAAFTGDGANHKVMEGAAACHHGLQDGCGHPHRQAVGQRHGGPGEDSAGAQAPKLLCHGHGHRRGGPAVPDSTCDPPAGSKTVEELKDHRPVAAERAVPAQRAS